MQERYDIYKCETCLNVVEMVDAKGGHLVCCGQPMEKLDPQSADPATQKHVPVIEQSAEGITVTVGSTLHPMEEAHYIEWIELTVDGVTYKRYLNPGDQPVAFFGGVSGSELSAREFCNLHGVWKG